MEIVIPQTCKVGKDSDLLNSEGKYLINEKFDGHRAVMYVGKHSNKFYSRNLNKEGQREENSDKIPHLKYLRLEWLDGKQLEDTILDGELVVVGNSNSSKVQSVMGALPEHSIEWQRENGVLQYKVFDILRFEGKDLKDLPLIDRLQMLQNIKCNATFFSISKVYYNCDGVGDKLQLIAEHVSDYKELLESMWARGSEGVILKDINSPYEEKRSKSWLKFKKENTIDLEIVQLNPPTKEYKGKQLDKWKYFDGDGNAVTKAWYNGWVGELVCSTYKSDKVKCKVPNLSDALCEKIKCSRGYPLGLVAEISYQDAYCKNGKWTLRHPRLKCIREDKNARECVGYELDGR